MKKATISCAVIMMMLICALGTGPAMAVTIGFDPASLSVTEGDTFDVDLFIEGLGDGVAPSLGTYDLDVLFDPAILAFDTVVFGDQLDIFDSGGNPAGASVTSPGTLNMFEVSLDGPFFLDLFQDDTFVLASISFNAVAVGPSFLNLDNIILGDGEFPVNPIIPDTIVNGSVTVNPVPEPATILLLGAGLAGMAGFRRRRTKKG